jgi:hypothetical protein
MWHGWCTPFVCILQVWTSLPTGEMLSEAAANMVRPPINLNSPAVKAVAAAGLDVQLLYDYRCCVWDMPWAAWQLTVLFCTGVCCLLICWLC